MSEQKTTEAVDAEPLPAAAALAATVIHVQPRPDQGDGGEWWIGLDLPEPHENGFWDSSCPDREIAERCAANCRKGLALLISQAIGEATAQAEAKAAVMASDHASALDLIQQLVNTVRPLASQAGAVATLKWLALVEASLAALAEKGEANG